MTPTEPTSARGRKALTIDLGALEQPDTPVQPVPGNGAPDSLTAALPSSSAN